MDGRRSETAEAVVEAARPAWVDEWPRYDDTRTPGRRLRGIVRGVLVILHIWSVYLAFLVARLFVSRSGARYTALQQWAMRMWSHGCLGLMGGRVVVQGAPPAPPYFLVSNHLSHADIFLLGTQVGARFVAKHEIAGWPSIGRMAAATGTLFIHRENRRDLLRINERIKDAMDEGRGVVLFPEGTSSRGDGLLPFMPSLLELPARHGWPVYYATLTYETPSGEVPADLFVCWWGGMPFASHFLRMTEMRSFTARLTFGSEPVRGDDRKELATRLRETMLRQFVPASKKS